ncbi:alpha/beta fold hydrolase [Acuticoccus sediminis]|uniref:alpha/beta fold hydrolase n=1 Tax=Acuticoccus sediminis TaxID=2184697 RepID=UPI001CFCD4E0|nr:alpha/beta fold hydrolase [Acuticoccus sediminis]
MALHPIKVDAAGGEYMDAVVVKEWLKTPGDRVARGELVVVVETAKAATEVEAETDGWLAAIHVAEGAEAPVGDVLGLIADSAAEAAPAAPRSEASAGTTEAQSPAAFPSAASPSAAADPRVVASPLARRLARAKGVSLADLTGTGPRGRIKARDVEAAATRQGAASAPAAQPPAERFGGEAPAPLSAPVLATGRAAPLVLLHGFGADRTSWHAVRGLLPSAVPTIAPDLPGHGKRAGMRAVSLDAIADNLADRLEGEGLDEIHLAGHSLGGAAAIALAARGRLVVRSLALLAPAGLGAAIHAGFISGLVDAETPEALGVWLAEMVAAPERLPDGFAAAALSAIARHGSREPMRMMARNLFPDGRAAFNVTDALARLEMPLRAVFGREDRIVGVPDIAALPPHAACHVLDGVGHVPQLEAPALTARLLTETVRSAG